MGNKWATISMMTIIAALSVTVTILAIVPAIQELPTQSTAMNYLGHVSLSVTDPDGNIVAYRQSDNFVTIPQINRIAESLFNDATFATGIGPWQFLTLCSGATLQTDDLCAVEMTTSRVDGTGGASFAISLANGVGGQHRTLFSEVITIAAADDGAKFSQLALFDQQSLAGSTMFANAKFLTITAQETGLVTAKYTITVKSG